MIAKQGHDHDLEAAFTALREEERRRAPSYEAVRDRALNDASRRKRNARIAWSVAAAAGMGALALAVTFLGGSPGGTPTLEAEIAMATELSSWSAPTDTFYDLASLKIPDSVPGLDVGSGYVPDALGSGDWQTAAATSSVRTDSEVRR